MKKVFMILSLLASVNLFGAEIIKDKKAIKTDKIGLMVHKGNAFFALQTRNGGVVTFGFPKVVLENILKDGKNRAQIPGVIANANKPEENALQFYDLQYDKKKGILIMDFSETGDYIVFNKKEIENFKKTLEKGGN